MTNPMTAEEFAAHRDQLRVIARFLRRGATAGIILAFALYGLAGAVLVAGQALVAALLATLGLLAFRLQWTPLFLLVERRFRDDPDFRPALALLRRERLDLGPMAALRRLDTWVRNGSGGHPRDDNEPRDHQA
jgi:hypothetical protein